MLRLSVLLALSLTAQARRKPPDPTPFLPKPITVGVLEGLGEADAMDRVEVGPANYKRHVRVLFRWDHRRWSAYPPEAAKIRSPNHWRVCHEGQTVGRFSSKTPIAIKTRALAGSQNAFEGAILPDIGKPTAEFGGYRGEDVPPPLVLTTGPQCHDPDVWRRDDKATADPKSLVTLLRSEIARPEWAKLPENAFEPPSYQFKDKDVSLFRVYEAKRDHRKLVVLRIVDTLLAEHHEMFFVPVGGEPKYIGASLNLAGAVDFDAAARSSLVLKMQAHNRDGYVLLDPDMKRVAEFLWSYH